MGKKNIKVFTRLHGNGVTRFKEFTIIYFSERSRASKLFINIKILSLKFLSRLVLYIILVYIKQRQSDPAASNPVKDERLRLEGVLLTNHYLSPRQIPPLDSSTTPVFSVICQLFMFTNCFVLAFRICPSNVNNV